MQHDCIFFIFFFLKRMMTCLFLCSVFTVTFAKFSTQSKSLSTQLSTEVGHVQEHNFSDSVCVCVCVCVCVVSSLWRPPSTIQTDYSEGCPLGLPETSLYSVVLGIPLSFLGHFPCYLDLLSSFLVFSLFWWNTFSNKIKTTATTITTAAAAAAAAAAASG